MKKVQKNIDETLFLRIIEKTADENEIALFNSWIEESVMHAESFDQFRKTYFLTSIEMASKEKSWEKVVAKVNSGQPVPDYIELPGDQKQYRITFPNTLMKVAASLILLIGVAILLRFIVFNSGQLTISGEDLKPNEAYVLPDESRIYLNGHSVITFSKSFGKKERNIDLIGEAFFEVKRNEKIPFIISTYKTTTRVLGTSFNVYSDSTGKVKVSVVTGVVAFYSDRKENGVRLVAGEQGIFNPAVAVVSKEQNNDPNFQSWKTGIFYFKETPISEALQLLHNYYSHVFVYESQEIEMPTLTTTLENQPLDAVLEELNLLLNTKIISRNDTIFFQPNS
jgi:transmembrane sensor